MTRENITGHLTLTLLIIPLLQEQFDRELPLLPMRLTPLAERQRDLVNRRAQLDAVGTLVKIPTTMKTNSCIGQGTASG